MASFSGAEESKPVFGAAISSTTKHPQWFFSDFAIRRNHCGCFLFYRSFFLNIRPLQWENSLFLFDSA